VRWVGPDTTFTAECGTVAVASLRHRDELLQVAGSLKMGTVSASELNRGVQGGGRPATPAGAIGEGQGAMATELLEHLPRLILALFGPDFPHVWARSPDETDDKAR
jgi:hypothetical protein